MKALTGAILNNISLMNTKLTRLYLLAFPAVFIWYFATGSNASLQVMALAFLMLLPSALIENSGESFATRWNSFENAWGLSPHLMVLSRYILFVFLSVAGLAVWLVLPFDFEGAVLGMYSLSSMILWAHFTAVAYYPIMYLLNPKTDNLVYIVMFGTIFLAVVLAMITEDFFADNYLLMAAVIAGLYAVSIALSMAFNAMHRGRVA